MALRVPTGHWLVWSAPEMGDTEETGPGLPGYYSIDGLYRSMQPTQSDSTAGASV